MLPVIVSGLGAGVAGLGYWLYSHGKLDKLLGKSKAATANVAQASAPAKSSPSAAPSSSSAPSTDSEVAARALYAFLKKFGAGTENAESKALALAFQKAHNKDTVKRQLGGSLIEDGLYGPNASAVLTLYTKDPIPGNPKYQPRAATLGEVLTNKSIGENGTNAGVAYRSRFNLIEYLKRNGHTNSPEERALVRQFQSDLNTDPLYPGPAYKPTPKPPVLLPALSVDGILGPKSKGTLLVGVGGTSAEDYPLIARALKGIVTDSYYINLLRGEGRDTSIV